MWLSLTLIIIQIFAYPKFHDFRNVNFGVSVKKVLKMEKELSGGRLVEKTIKEGNGYLLFRHDQETKRFEIQYLFYQNQFYKGIIKVIHTGSAQGLPFAISDFEEAKMSHEKDKGAPYTVFNDSIYKTSVWVYNSDASANYKIKLELKVIQEGDRYFRAEEYSPYF